MAISITSRVRNAMVGLSLGLCILFAIIIFLLLYVIEDQVFVNQIKVEKIAFENLIIEGKPQQVRDWQPANANIMRFDSLEAMPIKLPEKLIQRLKAQKGVHEYFDNNTAVFIASFSSIDNDAPYYLLYDVKDLLVVRDTKRKLLALIIVLTLIIAVVSVLLARRLSRSTLAPLTRLSETLQKEDLDHVVIELAKEFSKDEIGVLTRELAQALERVVESSKREYEFNRGVSHELRSPIQVAQAAAELLQLYADRHDTKLNKALSRLQRSVKEMNEVAEAFLWLASDRQLEREEMCTIDVLHSTMHEIQTIFLTHEIVFNIQTPRSFQYPVPCSALSVVLRNLVRNAVIHGEISPIIIDLDADTITVTNSIKSVAKNAKGFGLGLSIVERICDRFDCELVAGSRNKNQYSCSVSFS